MSKHGGTKEKSSQPTAAPVGEAGVQRSQRGFTVAEKWVIWAVFCLLVGLSSDLLIFPALLLLSCALVIFRGAMRTKKYLPALWLAGGAAIAGSLLIWWAIVS
jgi:hypothetical protein